MSVHAVTSFRAASILTLVTALSIAGCANPSRQRSERAVTSLDTTRSELTQGNQQIDEVLRTLDRLEARPADLAPLYKEYGSQVAKLESRADAVGRRVRDMRVRATEYSTSWQSQNETITNPDLRAAADDRAARVRSRYDQIDSRAQEVRAAYDPFITELRDLETFLSNDLTYAGVTAAKPVFESVRAKAAALKEKVNALVSDLDETYTRLSPTTAPVQ
jgi:chromosome segregation ATPase